MGQLELYCSELVRAAFAAKVQMFVEYQNLLDLYEGVEIQIQESFFVQGQLSLPRLSCIPYLLNALKEVTE